MSHRKLQLSNVPFHITPWRYWFFHRASSPEFMPHLQRSFKELQSLQSGNVFKQTNDNNLH